MPDKNAPKKTFPFIQIRIEPNIKEQWIKFMKEHASIRNMTHLVTASVEKFIETFDQPAIVSNGSSREMLNYLMEENRRKDNQLSEALDQMREIQIELANRSRLESNGELDLKTRIFEMISEGKFNTTQISKILKLDEKIITKQINQLIKDGSIEHDPTFKTEMKWRVKE